jgi:hypothetical protein
MGRTQTSADVSIASPNYISLSGRRNKPAV